jgi:hypothetical protein
MREALHGQKVLRTRVRVDRFFPRASLQTDLAKHFEEDTGLHTPLSEKMAAENPSGSSKPEARSGRSRGDGRSITTTLFPRWWGKVERPDGPRVPLRQHMLHCA